jgi:hypothetical protein
MKTCALAAAMLLILQAGSSAAATIHYWQFENLPGFLEDSVGSAALSTVGSAVQVALPESGRGSSFGDVVEGDARALEVQGNGRLTLTMNDVTRDEFTKNDFTVELFAHADTLIQSFGDTLAGAADGQQNASVAWLLQVRNTQLSLALCNGGTCEIEFSGLSVSTGKDYYLAAAVDLDGGQTTFYLQNLTDGGSLQSTTRPFDITTLNTPTMFAIGATGDGTLYFDGLIDEVRISNSALTEQQLLLVPEPSTAFLLAFALVGLAARRRRRAAR